MNGTRLLKLEPSTRRMSGLPTHVFVEPSRRVEVSTLQRWRVHARKEPRSPCAGFNFVALLFSERVLFGAELYEFIFEALGCGEFGVCEIGSLRGFRALNNLLSASKRKPHRLRYILLPMPGSRQSPDKLVPYGHV